MNNRLDPKKLVEFTSQIKNESIFPESLDEIILERYLQVSCNNVDNAMQLLMDNFKMRQKTPHLFANRNIQSSEMETACTTMYEFVKKKNVKSSSSAEEGLFNIIRQLVPLPKLTKENHKVTIIRLFRDNTKCEGNVCLHAMKAALLMFDEIHTFYDNRNGFVDGDIFILDVKGFDFSQFLDFYTTSLHKIQPVTLICNHVLNASPVFNGVAAIVKSILSKRVNGLFHFHRTILDLPNCIDKDVLPVEYGGNEKSVDEIYREWMTVFHTKREYLLNDENWKLNDSTIYRSDF